jgi:hypothetical protein
VEHWFDRLSRPHTRRAMLKGAVAAGAALAVPALRSPNAWASLTEPCFKPCTDAAKKQWLSADQSCSNTHKLRSAGLLAMVGGGAPGLLIGVLGGLASANSCFADAELSWIRDSRACRGSECGDPAKYPGGHKPRPKCTPVEEISCGDTCCNSVDECCQCKNGGNYVCCSAGRCEPTKDRGGCCPA